MKKPWIFFVTNYGFKILSAEDGIIETYKRAMAESLSGIIGASFSIFYESPIP